MIRKATDSDIEQVYSLLLSCADWVSQKGYHHWLGAIKKDKLTENIANQIVYVLEDDETILGTVTLFPNEPEYARGVWNDDKRCLYISKLATLPTSQGKGHASALLKFTEDLAKRRNIKILRLDCVSNYPQLNEYYLKRGFVYIASQEIDERKTKCNFYEIIF